MKEEEAKTKWCPHTRMVFGYDKGTTQPFNRFMCEDTKEVNKMQDAMNGTSGTKCVGSNCMMWVWDYTQEQIDFRHEQTNDKREKSSPIGHCGLVK